MGTARPLHKVDRTVDWEARCRMLEVRDADRAKLLAKVQAELRVACRAADRERQLRLDAERNTGRFHALLLAERIRKVAS